MISPSLKLSKSSSGLAFLSKEVREALTDTVEPERLCIRDGTDEAGAEAPRSEEVLDRFRAEAVLGGLRLDNAASWTGSPFLADDEDGGGRDVDFEVPEVTLAVEATVWVRADGAAGGKSGGSMSEVVKKP